MTHKTAKMQLLEHERGEQLETLLPRLYDVLKTHTAVAVHLRVTVSTLMNWLNRLDATRSVRRVDCTTVSIPSAPEGR